MDRRSDVQIIEDKAAELVSRTSRLRRTAIQTAILIFALICGGAVVFRSNADLFSSLGSVGVAASVIWGFYWGNLSNSLAEEYRLGHRNTKEELELMRSGDEGKMAIRVVNALVSKLPAFAIVILICEAVLILTSTILWGYGDLLLCKFATWEVSRCSY